MKTVNKFRVVIIAATIMVSSSAGAFAQTPQITGNKTRPRLATKNPEATELSAQSGDTVSRKTTRKETSNVNKAAPAKESGAKNLESVLLADPLDKKQSDNDARAASTSVSTATLSDVPEEAPPNRHEQASEEAAIVPYYNNFFNTYRLGPEDVISVSVFGQDRYSRAGIMIPPSGRISLALIPGGVFVNGKTVEEVAETIKKRYDEYIIDPQVSVSLEKASSYRYSIIGRSEEHTSELQSQ